MYDEDDASEDKVCGHDIARCCAEAIEHLANAAVSCCEQHYLHSKTEDCEKGCDCCSKALKLTCDAIAEHLKCLRGCC